MATMLRREDPVSWLTRAKITGPRMPANFELVLKKPKNSLAWLLGTMEANRERLRACVPPCTRPTAMASM